MSKEKVIVNSSIKDVKSFAQIIPTRKGIIAQAPATPPARTWGVNETAKALHPAVQHLSVRRVVQMAPDVKSFVLGPDYSAGTQKLAYFRPGQYIAVTVKIGNSVVTRPYSIASSPAQSLDDEYIITVKTVPDGFVSRFINNNWHVGTQVTASAPQGNFVFDSLRDSGNILGIAGGTGITPFISIAQAVADGTLPCSLTLLYGCRKLSDAVFKELLDNLAQKCKKIKVVYVFSDERVPGSERGFISRSLIARFMADEPSIFVCGPSSLYRYVAAELSTMNIERKRIRFEMLGELRDPYAVPEFPQQAKDKEFCCTVFRNGEIIAEFNCSSDESLLTALERNGVTARALCRSGECGFCRSRLKYGNVFIPKSIDKRRIADAEYSYIHPCCSYPVSDVAIEIY